MFKQSTTFCPDFQPGLHDVICAKTQTAHQHIGNRRFRLMLEFHVQAYGTAKTKRAKREVFGSIFSAIQSDGGRFIRQSKDGQRWESLSSLQVREKIGHGVRRAVEVLSQRTMPSRCLYKTPQIFAASSDGPLSSQSSEDSIVRAYPDMDNQSQLTVEISLNAVDTQRESQQRYNTVLGGKKPASLARRTNSCDSVSHAFYAQLISSTINPARSDRGTRPADFISDGTALLQHNSHEPQSSKCISQTSLEELPSCSSVVNSPRENNVDIPLLNEHVTLEEQVDFERLVDEALLPLFESCTVIL